MSKARANAWSHGRGSHESCKKFAGLNQPLIVEVGELLRPNAEEEARAAPGRRGTGAGSARRARQPTANQQEYVCVLYMNVCSTAFIPRAPEVDAKTHFAGSLATAE